MIQTHSIRHDEPQLFTKSAILGGARALHYPYLVVEIRPDGGDPAIPIAHITQVRDIPDLLAYADDAIILWLWSGRERSDFFRCTVGEFRANRDLISPQGILPVDEA